MTFRTIKFLLFVSICVPPNNPITACGATSFPAYHSFPKWAICDVDIQMRVFFLLQDGKMPPDNSRQPAKALFCTLLDSTTTCLSQLFLMLCQSHFA